MSKEIARKLIAELETNEELKAKVEGITDRNELLKSAREMGYDVTMEDFAEVEIEYRKARAAETDEKLSFDDLESVAGGDCGNFDDAPDGHEMGCGCHFHKKDDCLEKGYWCDQHWLCQSVNSTFVY